MLPRTVYVAPVMDVVPVEPSLLDRDNVASVIKVLCSLVDCVPAQFGYDHIFRRRNECLATKYPPLDSAAPTSKIVFVFAQRKKFNAKRCALRVEPIIGRERNGLEARLR